MRPSKKARKRERRDAARHGRTIEEHRLQQHRHRDGNSDGWHRRQAWKARQEDRP
jgi:hypothetical protein